MTRGSKFYNNINYSKSLSVVLQNIDHKFKPLAQYLATLTKITIGGNIIIVVFTIAMQTQLTFSIRQSHKIMSSTMILFFLKCHITQVQNGRQKCVNGMFFIWIESYDIHCFLVKKPKKIEDKKINVQNRTRTNYPQIC